MKRIIPAVMITVLLGIMTGMAGAQEENEEPSVSGGGLAPPVMTSTDASTDDIDKPELTSNDMSTDDMAKSEEVSGSDDAPQTDVKPESIDENTEVIIEPPSTSTDEEEGTTLAVSLAADEAIEGAETVVEEDKDTISITLDDVEMADVVRLFTRISGANIIATPSNLQGRVTVSLTDVEWKPAMDSILAMHNLALVERTPGTRIFTITTKPAGAPDPLVVETLFLDYATVKNVMNVVKPMIGQRGSVSPFASRNALVVRSTAANIAEVKEVIKNIDKLREQVFIEAKFMELNDDAIKDLGINWSVLEQYGATAANMNWQTEETRTWNESVDDTISRYDNRSRTDTLNEQFTMNDIQTESDPTRHITDTITEGRDVSQDINNSFTKAISDVRTAVLSADDFRIALSALKQIDGISIVSNPKIIVANEESALIHIGEVERPFESTITPATDTSGPVITYNPGAPVEFGVKLNVTPTVNTESNITVKIEPELTRFVRDSVAPNGQTYPIIATKKISTVFCLESGRTVAIGGLTETSDRDEQKKIPLLGDIPLIGKYLFSHSHTERSQRETIIFVTLGYARPNIIEQDTGLPKQTSLTQKRMITDNLTSHQNRQELEELRNAANEQMEKEAAKVREELLKE